MPLSLRRGTVTAIQERGRGVVRAEVDGIECVAYPEVTGPIALGDEVLVNTQARDLGLGSGGFDVLYANLTRGLGLAGSDGAHVMNLPYTPGQFATRRAEEDGALPEELGGMPVICCSVHSQVAPAAAGFGRDAAYVQLAGGALPVDLSRAVRTLQNWNQLGTAIAVDPCFGGDAQCVTPWAALLLARHKGHPAVICSIGPGIVGTGSRFGHGGLAAVVAANAAAGLGGRAVVAQRVSEADPRERHRGVSHHTKAVLDLCLGDVVVAPEHAAGWREESERFIEAGLFSHMGRGPDDDPAFFEAAFAAGRAARELL